MWYKKRKLELYDFSIKSCQNAGNAISGSQISKIFPGAMPLDPPRMCTSVFRRTLKNSWIRPWSVI